MFYFYFLFCPLVVYKNIFIFEFYFRKTDNYIRAVGLSAQVLFEILSMSHVEVLNTIIIYRLGHQGEENLNLQQKKFKHRLVSLVVEDLTWSDHLQFSQPKNSQLNAITHYENRCIFAYICVSPRLCHIYS